VVVVFAAAVFVPQAAVAQDAPPASQPEQVQAVARAAQLVAQDVPLASQQEQVRAGPRAAQLVAQGDPLVPDASPAVHSGALQADLLDAP
jgi:hypothetical protein